MRFASAEEETAEGRQEDSSFKSRARNEGSNGKVNPCGFDESEFGKILRILAERPSSVAK
jgi:hypothetical protein